MGAEQIFQEYGNYFAEQNLFLGILRTMFWQVLVFLNDLITGASDLLSKAYQILTYDSSGQISEFLNKYASTAVIGTIMALVLVGIGFAYILGSDNIKGTKVIQNFLLGLLVVWILPTAMSTINQAFIGGEAIAPQGVASVFKNNMIDLSTSFSGPDINVGNAFSEESTEYVKRLNINELVNGSETAGIDDIFKKKYDSSTGTADKNLGDGKILGFYIEWLSNYYYRYYVDMFPICLTLIATLCVIIFTFFKVAKLCYELIVHQLFAQILAMTDIATGAKLKEVLKSILATYIVLVYCCVAVELFNFFMSWITSPESVFNNFEAALISLPIALAVIDGPNLIEKLFGIDAGIKSGFHALAGVYGASKSAWGMAKGAGAIATGLGRSVGKGVNFARDMSGAPSRRDVGRQLRSQRAGEKASEKQHHGSLNPTDAEVRSAIRSQAAGEQANEHMHNGQVTPTAAEVRNAMRSQLANENAGDNLHGNSNEPRAAEVRQSMRGVRAQEEAQKQMHGGGTEPRENEVSSAMIGTRAQMEANKRLKEQGLIPDRNSKNQGIAPSQNDTSNLAGNTPASLENATDRSTENMKGVSVSSTADPAIKNGAIGRGKRSSSPASADQKKGQVGTNLKNIDGGVGSGNVKEDALEKTIALNSGSSGTSVDINSVSPATSTDTVDRVQMPSTNEAPLSESKGTRTSGGNGKEVSKTTAQRSTSSRTVNTTGLQANDLNNHQPAKITETVQVEHQEKIQQNEVRGASSSVGSGSTVDVARNITETTITEVSQTSQATGPSGRAPTSATVPEKRDIQRKTSSRATGSTAAKKKEKNKN